MDDRFRSIAALAASQHAVVSIGQLVAIGVSPSTCSKWVRRGLVERLGPRSLAICGSEPSWLRALTAASFDLDGAGFVAGRSGARLMGLDGFVGDDVELLVLREHRGRLANGVVRSTRCPVGPNDVQIIEGLRVLRAERLILDAPLFRFSRAETENAIDAALRLRLVSEQRLRTRVLAEHRPGVNGSRLLVDALVDSGGESRLERWFLRLCREAGLPRPALQKVYRDGGRTIARVDAEFPGGLVVEVAGHGTHATRRQRQRDAERHTELHPSRQACAHLHARRRGRSSEVGGGPPAAGSRSRSMIAVGSRSVLGGPIRCPRCRVGGIRPVGGSRAGRTSDRTGDRVEE